MMSEETINAIISYLMQQPYREVVGLLMKIKEELEKKQD